MAELENYITMVEKVTAASQQDDASSAAPSSPSKSLGASLGVGNGKPLLNGGTGGRRGSKEEADINMRSRPRPISSPVRFLKELEEEQKNRRTEEGSGKNGDGDDDVMHNSRFHRSAVSLKSPRTARSRLSSAMSKVDEEGDDDEETDALDGAAPVLTNKTTPSRGVLSRSRPVSASMKPAINTERKFCGQETERDNDGNHLHPGGHGTNGLHPGSVGAQPPLSPRLARRANALTPEQRKLSGQVSVERTLSTSEADSAANRLSGVSISDGQGDEPQSVVGLRQFKGRSRSGSRSRSPARELEQMIESADRVTEL